MRRWLSVEQSDAELALDEMDLEPEEDSQPVSADDDSSTDNFREDALDIILHRIIRHRVVVRSGHHCLLP